MNLKYLKSFCLFILILVVAKTTAQNSSDLYQNWVTSQKNNTTPTLPTFSFAGYKNGEVSLPSSFTQQVYDVTQSPYNAVPNDNISDKTAIMDAIADAEENPNGGVIFFPPGRFIVHDTDPVVSGIAADNAFELIQISKSNIVIKGSGSGVGGTELYQKSYTDTAAADKTINDYVCPYLFQFWNNEDSANTEITTVTADAERDDYTVQVASTSEINIGQWVELYVKNNEKSNDNAFVKSEIFPYPLDSLYDFNTLKMMTNGVEVREIHKVIGKTSNTITFKEPLHKEIESDYGWKINNFNAIEEVGIQDLKYTGGFDYIHLHHQAPQKDLDGNNTVFFGEAKSGPNAFLGSSGWSGIQFNHVVNGWVKNVEFTRISQAVQFKFSAYSTALDNKYTGNPGHNFITTNSATGCFIGKNIDETSGVWHGCGVNGLSIGNVLWRNDAPQTGTTGVEMHASQPRSTLFDFCKGGMFINSGGSKKALPNHLRHLVIWNFEGVSYKATDVKSWRYNNKTHYHKFLPPIISGLKGFTMKVVDESEPKKQYQENESEGTHVDEESLYEEQLKYRLGALPNWVENVARRKIIFSEDFRYEDGTRGFTKGLISDGSHTVPANILKRVGDVPDTDGSDSNNIFESIDRVENRIPNGNQNEQRTISIRGDDGSSNFAVNAYAIFTTLDLTDANPLISEDADYIYANFWTQRRYGDGDIATITLEISTDFDATNPLKDEPNEATWTTLSLHSGKLSDSSDNRNWVKGIVDLSTYTNSTTVTLALRYQGANNVDQPYTSINRNGTFYISDLQFIAQTTPIKNVWDGSDSTSFFESKNWEEKIAPKENNNIVIPSGLLNYPTTASALNVNNLTIESGASFIAQSTVTGNVTYKRNIAFASDKLEGWHLVGSPVNGQVYNDDYVTDNSIEISGNNRAISTYNNNVSSNNWVYLQSEGTGTFGKATGYSIKTSENKNISFSGTMNTDDVTKGITIGSGTSYNLISNPFTAYINSGTFLNLASNSSKLTSKTIWIWNPAAKNYDAKIASESFKIAPGQAFFVNCSTAGDVTFEEGIQNHQTTDTFLKTAPNPEITLNITDGNLVRYAKIYYNDNATKGFDNGFDGTSFSGTTNKFDVFTQLLAKNEGRNYQIQSLPNSNFESMVIPVGLTSEAGKEIVFSMDALNLPNNINVFLEDRENNVFTRLDENESSYKITTTKNVNGIGRFYLHTKSSVLSDINFRLENIIIYQVDNSLIRISGLNEGLANIKIFNLLGKQLLNNSFKSESTKDIYLPNLSKGIYIAHLTTEFGKFNKKIILE